MRKDIWNVFKKECARFFKDHRMVFTIILLPALALYAVYSLMGSGMDQLMFVDENYELQCYVQNMPESFAPVFQGLNAQTAEVEDVEAAKQLVIDEKADLLVLFPENFDQMVEDSLQGAVAPNVEVYYNVNKAGSLTAYDLFLAAADQMEASVVNVLDVNRGVENPNLAPTFTLLSSLLPMLVVSILIGGCVGVAPESIAGEKERGTIATLLVTPVSRTAIAIGKVSSLSLFAILAGLSSFLGLALSMPSSEMDMGSYGTGEYAALLCIIVTTVLLVVALVAVMSAYAKSVKEATSTATVLTFVAMLVGVIPMLSKGMEGIGWRLVPVLNSVLCMNDVFQMDFSVAGVVVTCLSSLVYTAVLVVVLAKMFNSEKIMFKK